ncbi:hypothetical protein Tco_1069871 [Tanacetum coccineum]|uniref:Reverse transcriptase domain-containing protein n=1 Tax=Tanacetum coccineum TaxID=301880 RepID=A0ABQ5HL62_9ASTR
MDEYHEVHEMQSDVQHNSVVDFDADYTSDSNIIPYDQYVEDNEEHVVQSNVSSVRNDALMSILDEMHEQGVQSRSANKQVKVVNDTLTSKLARYKELVGVYEQRAKFELTDRERKIDEQMRIIISDRNRKETSLKSELHSAQLQLRSTLNHHKIVREEAIILKKDFKQKEDKFLEEFLDIKRLKEKNRYFGPGGGEDNNDRKKAETSVPKPLSALTVYPPNTPVKLVPRVLPTKSQVKINLYVLTQLFTKLAKRESPQQVVTRGERGFEQTKRCYLTKVIPFFKTLKEYFAGIQTALFKEVKVMEEIFNQMSDEVDKQCAEIVKKNLLIENENLIANCLSNQLLYDVEKSRCLDLEAEMSKVHNESKHISKLEREYLNLQLKYQHLQESFDNNKSQTSQEAPDFNSFFKIKNLEHQIQEKDNVIRDLKVLVSNVNDRSCEPYNANDVTALIEQNECVRVELEEVKQHYKELFESIQITRASTNEKTSSLLTQIEDLKAQLEGNLKVAARSSVKTKVLAPGMYAIDVEPIPPRLKNNRNAHLTYINHLKESVETVREIVEEARVVKPLDNVLNYACQYTKLSQELVEYVIGTCPKEFTERDSKAPSIPLTRKKQVTFTDTCSTSTNNTQKHGVHQKTQPSNVQVIPSTGVSSSTRASGSKPRSNTKHNRILPAKSVNNKKVEDHPRTNKSVWTKVNRVDSSISSKHVVINSNSESVCKTCNKCLNSTNHEICVVNILSSVNATPTVKIVLNKGKQIWKPKGKLSDNRLNKTKQIWQPKGKLSDNSLNKTKRVWKATGKLFANVGYQWRSTGKKVALGKLCPLTRLPVRCGTDHHLVSGLRLFKTLFKGMNGSWLAPSSVLATTYILPTDKDLSDPVDTPRYAPSTSHSLSSSQVHPPVFPQEEPSLNSQPSGDVSLAEPNQVTQPPDHLRQMGPKITLLINLEPKNFKMVVIEDAVQAMQDEITNFDRLEEEGIDFEESFAPVLLRIEAISIIIANACNHEYDQLPDGVKICFLNELQVSQKSQRGIFINHAEYASRILKEIWNGFSDLAIPNGGSIENWTRISSGIPVDQTLDLRKWFGSLMYLTDSRTRTLKLSKWVFGIEGQCLCYEQLCRADHAGCQVSREVRRGSAQFSWRLDLVSGSSKKQKKHKPSQQSEGGIHCQSGRLGIVPYDLARTGGITQWDNPLVSTEKSLDETGSRHIADQNHKVIVLEDDIIGPSECNATTLPSIEFSLERNLSHLSRRLNMQSTVSLTPSKLVLKRWQSAPASDH